jgi:hypothetical protein
VSAQPGAIYLGDLKALDSFAHGGVTSDFGYWAPAVPLKIAGVTYAKGVCMHPETNQPGFAVYDVATHHGKTLAATVGIADAAGGGAAQFVVKLQTGGGEWREVYRSPVVGQAQSARVSVPLGEADKLRLEVNDGGDGIGSDHAIWADAKLSTADH